MNFINNYDNTFVKQKTLKNKILFSGVGLHNGKAVSMTIEPSEPNTGVVFERTDVYENNLIKAIIDNVDETCLCTKIINKHGVSVSTIEHLMAAFHGLEIDNVKVKINSDELPALDGSSYEYVKKIKNSGVKVQSVNRKCIRILKKVKFCINDRYILAEPSNELSLKIGIDYPNTIIGNSKFTYNHSQSNFLAELSEARTFTLLEDVEKMRLSGYAMGGTINNAIVVDKYKILNADGLRFEKEFVKHKALDCIGDFYLLGMPLIGTISTFAPGHKINQMFVKEILSNKENYN
ncbi:UDP-3-O-acyl-N-acetylglucosamine deacetylase, partial [Alphaproteobacteria bacterium]|nr:UDP-3-O-acyl-N-acetylglucosamine deacetylase [Alphaproteobacteria bacterium]